MEGSPPIVPSILLRMRPTRTEILAAGLLVLGLSALVVLIVVATIPPGGPPTLR